MLDRRSLLAGLVAAPASGWALPGAPRLLRYPRFVEDDDPQLWYPVQLARLALEAAGLSVRLEPSPEVVPQARALRDLRVSGGFQFLWTMTNRERERQARAIHVPIYKGMFGWRLLLARQDRVAELAAVHTLAQLRGETMLQGEHWPDTAVLRANGIPVVTSLTYEAMFKQLRLGRAAAFPRSIEEVWYELDEYGRGLAVVPGLALHYPGPIYYFVPREDEELALAFEVGLQQLRASGQFERIFQRYHGAVIARAGLAERRVIELINADLPPATPIGERELWLEP